MRKQKGGVKEKGSTNKSNGVGLQIEETNHALETYQTGW